MEQTEEIPAPVEAGNEAALKQLAANDEGDENDQNQDREDDEEAE